MDKRKPRRLFVLRRATACKKLQRCGERSLPHNKKIPWNCNFILQIKPKTDPIPVVFHNLSGYDSHLLFQAMSKIDREISCIPKSMEDYISFSLGRLRFIDSYRFLQASLDSLVKSTPYETFKYTPTLCKNEKQRKLLIQKGTYPYDYMDEWERFNETKLPDKEKFYSSLNDKHMTEEQYEHAQKSVGRV